MYSQYIYIGLVLESFLLQFPRSQEKTSLKKRLWEPIVSRLNNKFKTTTFIEKDFAQKGRFLQNFLKFPRIFHSENLSIAASAKI